MKIFGLTGGSGTGKTTVGSIFTEHGIYVARADESARRVEAAGTQCYDELVAMFGDGILRGDREIDRRALADIVFSDKKKLKILNRITHHYIKYDIIRELRGRDCPLAAIDGAVIIGGPVQELCEFMVTVETPVGERIRRITQRDGLTEDEARIRITAQPDDDFYRKHARFVIVNNGGYDELRANTERVIEKIKTEVCIE